MLAPTKIIGRTSEKKLLRAVLQSREAEFVAIYGRRRVGKTFLIRQFFKDELLFESTGEKDQQAVVQIARFCDAVSRTFLGGIRLPQQKTWNDAFELLANALEAQHVRDPKKPIIVFLDELPWMATHRSGLVQALDYIWNARLSKLPNVRLIVCGSAAAWMLDRLIHAKGGLYNRVTQRIQLQPFTLAEADVYLSSRGVKLTKRQTALLYMCVGGIPYYLKNVQKGWSVDQAIGRLCFDHNGLLSDEFQRLFDSLFSTSNVHKQIVRALASKAMGLSKQDIAEHTKVSSGGGLAKALDELEASGFVAAYSPFGKKKRDTVYRLVDEFSWFHLRWIESAPSPAVRGDGVAYWHTKSSSPAFAAWSGYAFENLCLKHIDQLLRALELEGVGVAAGSWRHAGKPKARNRKAEGAQVDLVLDRNDDTVTLCEMKYTEEPFVVTRKVARELEEKVDVFRSVTKTKKNVQLALVCSAGLKPNDNSDELVSASAELIDFFGK